MELTIEQIQHAIGAELIGSETSVLINHISVDSRSLHHEKTSLFFALVGDNHDGHNYISSLIDKGVQHFVVSEKTEIRNPDICYFLVNDTKKALQQLAAYYRHTFDIPVIGITGSNGKTIIKEWLSYLLSPDFSVVKSPKSYNSQVGVPLSLFLIKETHTLGIFEAGISQRNEMATLAHMIAPSIGVFTNIGSAHDNGFNSRKEKIQEKAKLFERCSVIVYKSTPLIEEVFEEKGFKEQSKKLFSWSFENPNATVYVKHCVAQKNKSEITLVYLGQQYSFWIPFADKASIENAITCFTTLISLAIPMAVILERMSEVFPVQMRLQIKPAINGCTLIDDSYNSDLQSLIIALDFLEQQKKAKTKTVILSNINESGLDNNTLYHSIYDLLQKNTIDKVFVIGEEISHYMRKYPQIQCFRTTTEFVEAIKSLGFSNEYILVKGSRSSRFEKIVEALEFQKHETVLEVNLDAIGSNLSFYKSKLKSDTKVMVMIKAFGYGNGGYELAKLLMHHRVDYLGVAFADEGIGLKKEGITTPIMVMNPEIGSYSSIVQYELEPEIYNFRGLNFFLELAHNLNLRAYPIHIKIDTGMHRLGFEISDIPKLIAVLKENPLVRVKSVLSHLFASDDPELEKYTLQQIKEFEEVKTLFQNLCSENEIIFHLANTSGIINYPQSHFDMVRLGIGLYGVGNAGEEIQNLENVSTLKSVISQVKFIKTGDSVGYSRGFVANKDMKIGTIPIGYADGISRLLSKKGGEVVVNGVKAPIIGNICMDMLMIDLTNVLCQEGDTVVLFGEELPVKLIAEKLETIPYEVLTQVSHRVKRVFYRD